MSHNTRVTHCLHGRPGSDPAQLWPVRNPVTLVLQVLCGTHVASPPFPHLSLCTEICVLPRPDLPAEAYKLNDLLQHKLPSKHRLPLCKTQHGERRLLFQEEPCACACTGSNCTASSFPGVLEPPWVAHGSDSEHFCSCRAKARFPVRRDVAVPSFGLCSASSSLRCLYKPGRQLPWGLGYCPSSLDTSELFSALCREAGVSRVCHA